MSDTLALFEKMADINDAHSSLPQPMDEWRKGFPRRLG